MHVWERHHTDICGHIGHPIALLELAPDEPQRIAACSDRRHLVLDVGAHVGPPDQVLGVGAERSLAILVVPPRQAAAPLDESWQVQWLMKLQQRESHER